MGREPGTLTALPDERGLLLIQSDLPPRTTAPDKSFFNLLLEAKNPPEGGRCTPGYAPGCYSIVRKLARLPARDPKQLCRDCDTTN